MAEGIGGAQVRGVTFCIYNHIRGILLDFGI